MNNQYKVMQGSYCWLFFFLWQQFATLRSAFDAIFVAVVVVEAYFLYDDSRTLGIVL